MSSAKRDPKEEREWRRRLILAARKIQHASRSFSDDLAEIREVRPEMDRLEQALRDSHERLEGLEDRLLQEIMRRLEEKSGRMGTREAQKELVEARTELQERARKCEQLTSEISTLSAQIDQDETDQRDVGPAVASKGALLNNLEEEISELHEANDRMRREVRNGARQAGVASEDRIHELEAMIESMRGEHEKALQALRQANKSEQEELTERLRLLELSRSEDQARHQTEFTTFADHAQSKIRRLESEVNKKRRGLKALTEENIQLQNQADRLRKRLEEYEARMRDLDAPSA